MELFQLQQFAKIVESETLVDAAKKLYLSQPTLSHNLAKLERELNCKLFYRTHNRMTLSSYGEILYQHACNIENELQQLDDEINSAKINEARHLKIGLFFGPYAAYAFFAVAANNPSLSFEFINASEEELRQGLQDGALDMIVHTVPLSIPGIATATLGWEQALIIFPKERKGVSCQHLSAEDLRALPAILILSGIPGYSEWYEELIRNAGVSPDKLLYEQAEEHLMHREKSPHAFLTTDRLAQFLAQGISLDQAASLDVEGSRREILISNKLDLSEQKARIVKEFQSAKASDMGPILSYLIFRNNNLKNSVCFTANESL